MMELEFVLAAGLVLVVLVTLLQTQTAWADYVSLQQQSLHALFSSWS